MSDQPLFPANRRVEGMENLPELGKCRVHLECGHTIIVDHSVDEVRYMAVTSCPQCERTLL